VPAVPSQLSLSEAGPVTCKGRLTCVGGKTTTASAECQGEASAAKGTVHQSRLSRRNQSGAHSSRDGLALGGAFTIGLVLNVVAMTGRKRDRLPHSSMVCGPPPVALLMV
jgi:hypothetical protein